MLIGIVSDGEYGDRAYENISKVFPCKWIQLESIPRTVILDDYDLDIPECDLYISYLRHPNQVLALSELGKPVLLGINFGLGFLKQAQQINPKVLAFPTMCSIEPTTGIPEIDEFARHFGRPIFEVKIQNNIISEVKVLRSSPCGSTHVAEAYLPQKAVSPTLLREFAIRVCHECRAPRFGHTCDKEISGLIHIRSLITGITQSSPIYDEATSGFISQVENEYQERLKIKSP
ncbi:MAG: DUF166 family protein [Candidatus Helarchaeota archaeon]